MTLPESPHQAAIAGAFKAKVRPALAPEAAELVRIYDITYGSASPGCCPEGLAAVLQRISDAAASKGDDRGAGNLSRLAALLRGEQP